MGKYVEIILSEPHQYVVKQEFIDVVCTRYDDYCMVWPTYQFEGNTISMTLYSDEYKYHRMLLLGKELGSSCSDRWRNVCETYFDFEGLCDVMCGKEKKNSVWVLIVLTLSFASAQLVFAIILITTSCVRRHSYVAVHKSDFSSDKSELPDTAHYGQCSEIKAARMLSILCVMNFVLCVVNCV
eukprot:473992_1